MHSETPSTLLQRLMGKAALVTRALEGKDREGATEALIAVWKAPVEAWRAAHAAEAAVKDLLGTIPGWIEKIESCERYIAGASARATACSEEVQVVWILLAALTASVVPPD